MDWEKSDLENKLLDRIRGRIKSGQSALEKESILAEAFLEVCNASGLSNCLEKWEFLTNKDSQGDFFKGFRGYGVIDALLDDPLVEDIIVNGTQDIYIHHARDGLKQTDKRFSSISQLELFIKKLLAFSGANDLKKINNIDLPGMRGRVNIVYTPFGPDLTITKIKTDSLSIIDLILSKALNSYIAAMLWLYIEGMGTKPANILISGGPGSGKTTLLNSLLSFIPSNQHTVVIEDSLELVTDWIGNISRLESAEGLTLADLVKNSLRMRPERIIIGEVRGNEAEDMITAMNVGKSCMATIHASSVRETILRLANHPMNIPESLINLIDVFIVMKKISVNNSTVRVLSEVTETAGREQKTVLISPLWKYDLASHSFNENGVSTVYRDKLAQITGKSGRQILDEIKSRQVFLDNLAKAGINSTKEVAFYCELFISDPQKALKTIQGMR